MTSTMSIALSSISQGYVASSFKADRSVCVFCPRSRREITNFFDFSFLTSEAGTGYRYMVKAVAVSQKTSL